MTNANLLICCLKALPDEPDIKVMQSMEFEIRKEKLISPKLMQRVLGLTYQDL